jgi:hypothetical protein
MYFIADIAARFIRNAFWQAVTMWNLFCNSVPDNYFVTDFMIVETKRFFRWRITLTTTRIMDYTLSGILVKTKTKLHGLSPRANYTDRATAAWGRSDCQLVRIDGATWSATLLGPLEGADLKYWIIVIEVIPCKGSNKVGFSLPSLEDRKRSIFLIVVF